MLSLELKRRCTDPQGFLGVINCLLPVAGIDEGVDASPIPTRVHDKSFQDRELYCHGRCYLLHILDCIQQHFRVLASQGLLDARARSLYEPVRDVVVSAPALR